ncbi:hypothetical protein TREMEDRAFT_71629 [Tremella mesenterica DSM 1558]|uniref:uncharacterized protein n=1 Tax=Tremella mesenterica (strain ATCC 24925 / CBS 8224 / DSM 1558 / NBRC 9311 / NRRL Y-6157 / RJB 2259-6 / UBC 559-6) TaxID=578456 RepID=UPI0003F4A1DD|nr:uncharacterized protein TREMEDRAFT_71629 [Tremella mesenterica DSM 1558]EIW69445.1 hypothetical protein TREMEDRAFT_71629 [Tremella mesenterica DSM 1558]
MPPRKGQQASPVRPLSGRTVAPSPARSTKSVTSKRGVHEEDWENESLLSTSFKVPNSRSSKVAAASSFLTLKDTSVNVAAAFHAAQTGQSIPTPTSERGPTSRAKPPSKPAPQRAQRAKSPAEQIASAARALSPVRFFLRPTDNGDSELSGEYNSFSSLATGNHSGETSYDYRQEEEYVKAAQAAKTSPSKGPRHSDSKRRGRLAEDMPYRPDDDGSEYESEYSGGEGEGLVKAGALDGRAETRGKRKEKGEGYLGMGLGFQPRVRRKSRKSGGGVYSEEDEDEEEGVDDPDDRSDHRHTPMIEVPPTNNHQRSPTPAQLLRALSPRIDRLSPGPSFHPRRRQPSSIRTIITNVLHGVALMLRFLVEAGSSFLKNSTVKPYRFVAGSSRSILSQVWRDWWKWVGAIFALSIALRILNHPWHSKANFTAPDTPPTSIDELIHRLTSLEHALSTLSTTSHDMIGRHEEGQRHVSKLDERVIELKSWTAREVQQVAGVGQGNQKEVQELQQGYNQLKAEVAGLGKRMIASEEGLSKAQNSLKSLDSLDREVHLLRARVDNVEIGLKEALDDGRLLNVIERILPKTMPVKMNSRGSVDIDPIFWTEMKKVLIGKSDVEGVVKNVLKESPRAASDQAELDSWAERLFEKKAASGVILSRSDFLKVLDSEMADLRHQIEALPRNAKTDTRAKSTVTVKSAKGDDLTSILQQLIDAALLKYSKDVIAKPDYALFTAGGRIVPSITSDTLVLHSPSTFGRILFGRKDVEGRSPATAIHPDNAVGECWPFKGSQGQLGVLLTRRVIITDITVEHAASELALDISTAPKLVQVWAVVEGEQNKAKLMAYHESRGTESPSVDNLLLTEFTYDPNSPSPIQTVPVSPDIVELGIDTGIVIFKIESNWGADFTCLYRVRVHGEAS